MVNIAVHTIAKDEALHVERWAKSAEDADLLLIADTGSTDGTQAIATDLGVEVVDVHVAPWRFDLARNAGLALLPADIDWVFHLDMDEILVPGWREKVEKTVADHPEARRLSNDFVWSWQPGQEGIAPDVQFISDKMHSRAGWRWHGAVHEVLVACSPETLAGPTVYAGFEVHHYPDHLKPRSNYLPLLEIAVREEPHNPRQRFYLGREYFFHGRWDDARRLLVQFLEMPEATWAPERAEGYRYIAKMDDDPERWLIKALAEAPGRRDAVVDLVDLYEKQERWVEAAGMAARALRVTHRPGDYMSRARTWDNDRLRALVDRVGVFD